jgi:hypothetical protein
MTGTTVATLAEQALRRIGVAVVPVADRPGTGTLVGSTDLATRALLALAVMASDETPSASDLALAVSKVQAVHDAMALQGYISWDINHVPQGVSEEYVNLTALHLAQAFGKAGDPAQQPVIEARVRKAAMVLSSVEVATNSVMSVHQDLSMRGKVRWTVFDIPPAVESVYVYLAANDIAPLFGVKPNPADDQWAEHALARYIALPTSGEHVVGEYY